MTFFLATVGIRAFLIFDAKTANLWNGLAFHLTSHLHHRFLSSGSV